MRSSTSNPNVPCVAQRDESHEPLPHRPDTVLHWTLLAISSAVVLLAVLLRIEGERHVVIPGLGIPLPGTCTFKQYVGADCPGCGLTRCFVSMGHGQLQRAWHFNPAGVAFFAIVAGQIPFRAMQLWRVKRGAAEIRLGWWGYSAMLLILAALLVQWVVRLILAFA